MENNSLQHHGILGMKWGIRRYQNKDGTLTKAGKKRYDKEMEKLKKEEKILKAKQRVQAKFDKLEAKRKENEELKKKLDGKEDKNESSNEPQKVNSRTKHKGKSILDMSDDDLREWKTRLEMEKSVRDLTQREKSRGRKIVESVGNEMLKPAALDLGKQIVKSLFTYAANTQLSKLGDDYKAHTNNKKKS